MYLQMNSKNSWFDDFEFNVEIYTYVWFGPRLAITIIELKKNKRLQFKKTNFVWEIETKRIEKLIIDTNILFLYSSFIHHLCSIGYRIMTFLQYYLNFWWKIYLYYNILLRIILNGYFPTENIKRLLIQLLWYVTSRPG